MGSLNLVTAPVSLSIVTLAEAKNFSRIDISTDDTLVTALIAMAVEAVENFTGLKLGSQTWDYFLDNFPCSGHDEWWDGTREGSISQLLGKAQHIVMPVYPLISVTYLKTFDDDNTEYTMDADDYVVDTAGKPGRISLKRGAVWPSTVLRANNGILIRVVCGQTVVPEMLKHAIRMLTAHFYEHRGDGDMSIPANVQSILAPFRVIRV